MTFRNQATGWCLTAKSPTTVGTDLPTCGVTPNLDYWNVSVLSSGRRTLGSDEYLGHCLDDSDQYGLRLYPCNSGIYQNWGVSHPNTGQVVLQNEATGKCLDDSAGYGLRTFTCNASAHQEWH